MDIFEYKVIEFNSEQRTSVSASVIEKELNDFGKDAWELVSLYTNSHLGPTKYALVGLSINIIAVLKRKQILPDKEVE